MGEPLMGLRILARWGCGVEERVGAQGLNAQSAHEPHGTNPWGPWGRSSRRGRRGVRGSPFLAWTWAMRGIRARMFSSALRAHFGQGVVEVVGGQAGVDEGGAGFGDGEFEEGRLLFAAGDGGLIEGDSGVAKPAARTRW